MSGKVFSGIGKGAKFAELPWVKKQIEQKLGFTPYPGTLNIRLDRDCIKVRKLLEITNAIEILPAHGYCSGRCFKAYIMGDLKGAIVLPNVENYPKDVLEIIAPLNLRRKFGLIDGDKVEVKVEFE
ncbi:MAG: DUF120 domain-containing protein [Candidatus Bathyarchaeia archaeon]